MKQERIGHPARPHIDALNAVGYCVVDDLIPLACVRALAQDLDRDFCRTPVSQGPFYGADTVRFGGLLNKSSHVAAFIQQPLILEIVETMLGAWCDTIQLNLTQAIEIRPGAERQVPHRDQDMWRASAMLPPDHEAEFLVNVMWPFTPYTPDNGSTILWPGSHRRRAEDLIDPSEAVSLAISPGSALLFLGSTLHSGGANRTMAARRGMIVSYSLGWLKPYEIQTLVYPPETARHFSPALARLVGLVTVLCRSPERLELATGDRRDDQAHRRVQAGGGADCTDQRVTPRQGCIGFGDREVDAGQMGVTVSAI